MSQMPNLSGLIVNQLFPKKKTYNKDAAKFVDNEHGQLCRQNYNASITKQDLCIGCNTTLPQSKWKFCSTDCPKLKVSAKKEAKSREMGNNFLLPLSSSVRDRRLSQVGFEKIVGFLYDNHLGGDLATVWRKVFAVFVFRNHSMLKVKDEVHEVEVV